MCSLDIMTLTVLCLRQLETSLCRPAFPACEPSPAIPATSAAPSRGGAVACPSASHLCASGTSVHPACAKERCAGERAGGKGGVHREVAPQLDPTRTTNGPPTRWRDQRMGRRRATTGLARRFSPWVTCRTRRASRCGCKPSETVWRRKKWPTLTACSCRRGGFLVMN
jgi:hypothetical protein